MSDVKPYYVRPGSGYGSPAVEGQHPDVFPASSLALVNVFTEVVRARFTGENRLGLPYYWSPDASVNPADENDEVQPTKIFIESAFNAFPDARNPRPAIYVDKGSTVSSKIAVGNRAEIDHRTRDEIFLDHELSDMSIEVKAETRGQSATLADHVFHFLKACMNHICAEFSIHDISPPVLNKTLPYRDMGSEIELWSTTISFQVTCKAVWRTKPIAPVLQQIRLNLQAKGALGTTLDLSQVEMLTRRRT